MATTKTAKAALRRKPHAIIEPSYSIGEFCAAERISRPTYHEMRRVGLGPREMRVGSVVRISHRARLDWQAARENPKGKEAEAVRKRAEALRERGRRAAKKSVESPRHVSRRV